jgi:hypothetical protein
MALEVRELVIKATIVQEGGGGSPSSSGDSSNSGTGTDQIVNACVEKILEILKDNHER